MGTNTSEIADVSIFVQCYDFGLLSEHQIRENTPPNYNCKFNPRPNCFDTNGSPHNRTTSCKLFAGSLGDNKTKDH